MKAWFAQLAPREQKLVLIGGGAVLLTLIYLLLIEPGLQAVEMRRNSVKAQQQELLWMQQAQVEARSLGAGQPQRRSNSTQAPYIVVDAAIRRARLGTPERIDPQGRQGTKVQFAEVDFNRLILMLADLQQNQGLKVSNATLSAKESGNVSARITLEREP